MPHSIAGRLYRAFVLCAILCYAGTAHAATRFSIGDATIAQSVDGSGWTLTAGGASLQVRAGTAADFSVLQLTSPSGHAWSLGTGPDTTLMVEGQALTFGAVASGFTFRAASVAVAGEARPSFFNRA